MAGKHAETELYEPIKRFFLRLGYDVNAEVNGCDLVASRDGELVVVELKLSFNMTLLFQALDRQKSVQDVYVAIPRPKRANDKNFLAAANVARRLGLGLITVALDSPARAVDVLVFPQFDGKVTKPGKANALKNEIKGRRVDANTGGSARVKLNTAYRERCIRVACALERSGPATATELEKEYGCPKGVYGIVYGNHYGWFEKTKKGVYDLSAAGRAQLEAGGELIDYYRRAAREGALNGI